MAHLSGRIPTVHAGAFGRFKLAAFLRPRLLTPLVVAGVASGCGLFSIESLEPPFPENPPFGQVVQEIRVEGNRHTRTWIIESAMASRVGEPYTSRNAEIDHLYLIQLGSFTGVSFRYEPVDGGIALIAVVREASPYVPSLSFKLTQENGVEIGPAFSSPNFFGTAARVSAYARFGGATNFGVRYWDPWVPGKSWLFGYRLQYAHIERQNELDNFGETSEDVFFQFRRNFRDDVGLGLRFRFLSVKSDVDGKTLSPTNRDNVPSVGLFVDYDSRNSTYPTRGWLAELEAAKYGVFGGSGDFWRVDADVRRYHPLSFMGPRHSVAAYSLLTVTRGEVGKDIPVYMDFHIGGTNSVRGWPLGARVGQNQWLNTVEYWFLLTEEKAFRFWFIKWRMGMQLAAFGDVGTAWSTGPEFGDNFIGGWGVGGRLIIPVVVLLRLDFAYAQDQFGIKIAVGGGEKAMAQKLRVR